MCRKFTTRDLFSEGSNNQDFLRFEKVHRPRPGLNPRILDPVASMITTGPPGSTPPTKITHLITVKRVHVLL